MEGFNIKLTINGKTILGRTEDNLNISAIIKSSLTKDDNGEASESVTGHTVTFSCNALVDLNASSGTTTKLDRDDIMELALKKGDAAKFPVEYALEGGDAYTGTGIITGLTEGSNASGSDDATLGLNISVKGFAKKTS